MAETVEALEIPDRLNATNRKMAETLLVKVRSMPVEKQLSTWQKLIKGLFASQEKNEKQADKSFAITLPSSTPDPISEKNNAQFIEQMASTNTAMNISPEYRKKVLESISRCLHS